MQNQHASTAPLQPTGNITSDGPGREYDTDEKRRQVHDMYLAAEEVALHSTQIFDNRTGFTTPEVIEKLHAADDRAAIAHTRAELEPNVDPMRGRSPVDSGQYGEGGKAPQKTR